MPKVRSSKAPLLIAGHGIVLDGTAAPANAGILRIVGVLSTGRVVIARQVSRGHTSAVRKSLRVVSLSPSGGVPVRGTTAIEGAKRLQVPTLRLSLKAALTGLHSKNGLVARKVVAGIVGGGVTGLKVERVISATTSANSTNNCSSSTHVDNCGLALYDQD